MDKPQPSQPEAVPKFGLVTTEGVQELFGTAPADMTAKPSPADPPPPDATTAEAAADDKAEAPPKKRTRKADARHASTYAVR